MLRLHHVHTAQLLTAAGVEKARVAVVLEPVVALLDAAAVGALHLDALQAAEALHTEYANPDRQEDTNARHGAKAPVGLLDEVLQVHSVQACDESSHGQTEGTHTKLQLEKHESVSVCVKDGADTRILSAWRTLV